MPRESVNVKSSGAKSQAEEARNLVREVTQMFGEFNLTDFITICKNLGVQGIKKRAMEWHKRYDAFLGRIISTREDLRRQRKASGKADDAEDGEEKPSKI